ncbi:TetR/AcrR family transcriptional regulator [Pseudooceanicola sp.]|uniref:TetR/AcrR family transcriptional regulator n=1 Tax=Pseudooceanicola sp. TaxID=1914328 RepID=UPI002616F318|nr:TetR/AcrR family transcriptional regulator [Pseudooceanicola sp.]MDF1855784.1 TetR/AcrR family transcriptional regulator [Pseudooceanicola sp.]
MTTERPKTSNRLVKAALELFQMRGYHAVGVAEILERSGCPKGSLYHHFPGGKAALAVAAIDWLAADIVRHFDESADKSSPAATMVGVLFRQSADWVTGTGYASGALFSVMAQEVVPQEAELTARLGQAYVDVTRACARALAAGGGDPDMAGPVLALLDGAVAQARAQMSPVPFQAAEAAAIRLVG